MHEMRCENPGASAKAARSKELKKRYAHIKPRGAALEKAKARADAQPRPKGGLRTKKSA